MVGNVTKFVPLLAAMILSVTALAADESVADAPAETVDVIYVVIFGIIFVGMIVGFFVYLWWAEKKRKEKEK